MRAIIFLGAFMMLVMYSCDDRNTNCNSSSNDTIIEVVNPTQEEITTDALPEPDNFLGVKLGTDFASVKQNHPNITQDSNGFYSFDLHLMGCAINFNAIGNPFTVNTTTKAGDEVKIDVLFYRDKVAAIYAKYENGLTATDKVYAALVEKYGEPSLYEVNTEYYNTKSYYWMTEKSVLNMLYKSELGDLFLVFADRGAQDLISSETSKENSKSIE